MVYETQRSNLNFLCWFDMISVLIFATKYRINVSNHDSQFISMNKLKRATANSYVIQYAFSMFHSFLFEIINHIQIQSTKKNPFFDKFLISHIYRETNNTISL